MVNIITIRKHQKVFLKQVKEKKEPTYYTIRDILIKVNPGVFPPATDTKLLAENIKVNKGDRTLDLTSGSGTFSVIAGLQGATGIAIDINPQAVKNSQENFQNYGVKMQAVESDLYEQVPNEKFDYIFANGPFFEGKITNSLDHACYGAKSFNDSLLSGVHKKLKPTGKLLMVLSAWSDLEYFNELISKYNLKSKQIAKRTSDDGERNYLLFEITL